MTLRAAALLLTLLSLTAAYANASPANADPTGAEPAMLSTSQIEAAALPSAKRMPALVDTALYGSVVAWRTLDFFSTEQCLRSTNCSESELPAWLVESKPAFIVFETGTAAGEIVASRWLHARGHGRMARALDLVSLTCGTWTVAHNYSIQQH